MESTQNYPKVLYLARRLREQGLQGVLRRLAALFGKPAPPATVPCKPAAAPPVAPIVDETLNLQPGEMVDVKSKEEILATLDGNQRLKGLVLMPEMLQYCGRRMKVFKRVESILIETTGEIRRTKNTVLLDGSFCTGFNNACHRSCFFFWREAWLRRVESKNP